jgi:hypothetical protein
LSAKLESGSPFTAAVDTAAAAFGDLVSAGLVAQQQFVWAAVDVQSLVAVPFDEPDTVQVAFAVEFEIAAALAGEASARIGFAVNVALAGIAPVAADSSLFEVAFTITPCHHH